MQLNDLKLWLGDALPDLDADQLARLQRESDRLDRAYPHEDDAYRWTAGMSAATQYVFGVTTVADAGRALTAARIAEAEAMAASRQIAAMAAEDKTLSQVQAAFIAGIDRKWLIRYLEI
jgi:hypothetical protein